MKTRAKAKPKASTEPLQLLGDAEGLLAVDDVGRAVRVSRRTLLGMVKDGGFPRPVKVGALNRWHVSTVREWIEARKPPGKG